MAEQETRVRTWTISAHFADEHGTSTLLHGPEVDRPGVDVVELAPVREALRQIVDELGLIGIPKPTGQRGNLHPDALLPHKDVLAIENSFQQAQALLASLERKEPS